MNLRKVASSRTKLRKTGKGNPRHFPNIVLARVMTFSLRGSCPELSPRESLSWGRNGSSLSGLMLLSLWRPRQLIVDIVSAGTRGTGHVHVEIPEITLLSQIAL